MEKKILKRTGGRNNTGKITMRHIGGGFKRFIRPLEYNDQLYSYNTKRYQIPLSGKVEDIEYDPNRSAYLAKCKTESGKTIYKIYTTTTTNITKAPLSKQDKINIMNEKGAQTLTLLKNLTSGDQISNVSIRKGTIGKYALTHGAACKVIKQEGSTTVLRLPSKEIKRFSNLNSCIRGVAVGKGIENLGKAGKSRRLGIRPRVRGVAMNPIDHPNGGKTHSSKIKNLWGNLAKWQKTKSKRLIRK